ncbi:NUDIX domain-containing protein [Streptomyces afghaniensis]|uniref:NUDIX domain-containing protein n=1 Tax=Streptomyces afghaniensis TaxID=66865 RepID=UPI0037AA12F8
MTRDVFDHRVTEAAAADVRLAKIQVDGAGQWLTSDGKAPSEPLAAEVWVFDEALTRVLLVHHRWRGWVPPGGRVEPGETPREGARRELFEETGIEVELLPQPAAATVRSYRPGHPRVVVRRDRGCCEAFGRRERAAGSLDAPRRGLGQLLS